MNEIRNELLLILQMANSEDEQDKRFRLEWLLERFEYDLERKEEDLQNQLKEVKSNQETLKYVRKELGIKER